MAASNKLKGQLNLTIKYLGDQIQLVPSYTDNHRAHDKSSPPLSSKQLLMKLENSAYLSNYKIMAGTPTTIEEYSLLVLDYDDHIEVDGLAPIKQQRTELHRKFSLEPTFSVKTTTGDGVHEYYLIPTEIAKKIGKWSTSLNLPSYSNVEVKVGLSDYKTGFPGPGSFNKEKERYYQILDERPVMKASEELVRHLTELRRSEIESFTPLTGVESEVNSPININKMRGFLVDKTGPYVSGIKESIKSGRNNKLYQLARDCFKYNVSKQVVFDSLTQLVNNDSKVFYSPLEEYEFEATITSAYNSVQEAKQYHDKAVDSSLAPYVHDAQGNHTITYESYLKKTKFLANFQLNVIMEDERLRSMFCELVIFYEDQFYVPNIEPIEYVTERFEEELAHTQQFDTIFNAEVIIDCLAKNSIRWKIYSVKAFKDKFRISIDKKSSALVPLANWPMFQKLSINLRPHSLKYIYYPSFRNGLIFDSRRFFMAQFPAVNPLRPDEEPPTETEIAKIEKYLSDRLSTLVDPDHFEEESKFILARMALLVKKPTSRLENILVIKGLEGSGKSVFFNLFRPLLNDALSIFYSSVDQAFDGNFGVPRNYTHIDDSSTTTISDKVIAKIKNKITSPTQTVERKGVDLIEQIGVINLSMTTNNEIINEQMISGRRWTIINNNKTPNREQIRDEIRNMLIDFYRNNLRLYRVFATYMSEYDTSHFVPGYKSHWQLDQKAKALYGDTVIARMLTCIVNYGFYPPTPNSSEPIQIIKAGQEIHATDFVRLFYINSKDKKIDNPRSSSIFKDAKDVEAKVRAKIRLKEISPMIKTCKNSVTRPIQLGNHRISPSIQDLIRLLALYVYGNEDEKFVNLIIMKYGLNDHWNWDGSMVPTVENLGNIDPFAHVDTEEFDDEDEEENEF